MSYERVEQLKWQGKAVLRGRVPVADLPDALPTFRRHPFALGEGLNKYSELIAREPFQGDSRAIPVATVSKRYALVQHVDLARQVRDAVLDGAEEIAPAAEAEVYLSEYGERFAASICLKESLIDPGDNYPLILRLFVLNSVDGSCPVEISLRWLRLVCTNGMTTLRRESRLTQVHHLDRIDPVAIRSFLGERVPEAVMIEREAFNSWLQLRLEKEPFQCWIEQDVVKSWGPHAAARLFHICSTGFDGRVGREKASVAKSPLDVFVSSDERVPGAEAPVGNLYHVYQALVWLAERRGTIEDREARGAEALALIKKLGKRLAKR